MPALNFKSQFAAAVEAGTKCQTIRAARKDGRAHCKVGDTIKLYTGMRQKSCRPLREGRVIKIDQVTIGNTWMRLNGKALHMRDDNIFAKKDGFESFMEMADWFGKTHGLPFTGVVIYWEPLPNQNQIDTAALRAELAYLKCEMTAAPSWGAAVSEMQERINGINRTLAGGA